MTQSEDQLNLHAARLYLTRLLPHLAPFTGDELRSLTLKAGLWALYQHTHPVEPGLGTHLLAHARLLREQENDLAPLKAQHLRPPFPRHPLEVAHSASEIDASTDLNRRLDQLRHQARRLGLPWFTRHSITQSRTQVSYRVTRAFEQALDEAWKEQAPRRGSRNALQTTLVLAYLALPDLRQRVRTFQDFRYGQTWSGAPSDEAARVIALLAHCHLPARGAPTLRHQVVQLSYRTTVMANTVLRRSLRERTLAYLHIDLLALYLTAPDVRALIDHAVENRAQE